MEQVRAGMTAAAQRPALTQGQAAAATRASGQKPRGFDSALFDEGMRVGNTWRAASQAQNISPESAATKAAEAPSNPGALARGWETETVEADFSWDDLIDIVNPLQHIPVVGSLYRTLTGDTISSTARVAGATLYGGPLGMVAGAANVIIAEANGADLGDTIVAGLLGRDVPGAPDGEGGPDVVLAAVESASPPAPDGDAAPESEARSEVATSFAPSRPAQAQVLDGDAALSALLGDLRAGGTTDTPPAVPRAAVEQAPLDTTLEPATGHAEAGAAQALSDRAFAQQMLLGLDKYRDMAIERGGAGRPATDTKPPLN
jgi:hypothetical protein